MLVPLPRLAELYCVPVAGLANSSGVKDILASPQFLGLSVLVYVNEPHRYTPFDHVEQELGKSIFIRITSRSRAVLHTTHILTSNESLDVGRELCILRSTWSTHARHQHSGDWCQWARGI
jgi:hypothetical protein